VSSDGAREHVACRVALKILKMPDNSGRAYVVYMSWAWNLDSQDLIKPATSLFMTVTPVATDRVR